MKFVLPEPRHREAAVDMIEEFRRFGSDISGDGGLNSCLKDGTYGAWLDRLTEDSSRLGDDPADDGRLPALTYFYVREEDERIVGMVNIRPVLNDFYRRECGHIGYCIRPTERGRGYATMLLRDALCFCQMMGLDEVLLCCRDDNPASAAVIRKCGGKEAGSVVSDAFRCRILRFSVFTDGAEPDTVPCETDQR